MSKQISLFDEFTEKELDIKQQEIEIKQGDIFKLGNHYLMCGDATSEEDVAKLVNGQIVDLVFTDPPYGMKKESEGVLGDNLNYDDLLEFNKKWVNLSFDLLKDNGSWYCWGIDEPLMDIYSEIIKPKIKKNELTFRNLITWDKGSGQGQLTAAFRSYARADEKCLFIMKGVQGFNNNSDQYYEGWETIRSYLENEAKKVNLNNKKINEIVGVSNMYAHWFTKSQWTLIKKEQYEKLQQHFKENNAFKKEYKEIKSVHEKIKREYEETKAYFNNTHDNMNNVWKFLKATDIERIEAGNHATPKPIPLVMRAIKSSSRKGETVLDLFGGGGSTLIACEWLKRKSLMMEINPFFCNVIIKRWENLTGKKHEKIND